MSKKVITSAKDHYLLAEGFALSPQNHNAESIIHRAIQYVEEDKL